MLMVVAYDITDPSRLRQVARHCEDYGIRVQYSIFECRLPAEKFEAFWRELTDLINPATDRIVAYRLCARCAQEIYIGGTMITTADQKITCYVF